MKRCGSRLQSGARLLGAVVLILTAAIPSRAASHLRLNVTYSDYFGGEFVSLNSETVGYGGEILTTLSNSWAGVSAGLAINSFSGTERLRDGATTTSVALSGLSYGVIGGVFLNMLPTGKSAFAPYLTFGPELGMVTVKLPKDQTFQELSASTTTLYYGGYIGAGMALGAGKGKGLSYHLEFRYKRVRANIFSVSGFELDTSQIVLGIGF